MLIAIIIFLCFNIIGEFMKRFNMIDESFICENCGKVVPKLNYTARDHCQFCLFSKHVDVLPGDRANECCGLLEPIAIEKFKDSYKIIYKCQKCGQIHRNIMAIDDNFDILLEIVQKTSKR